MDRTDYSLRVLVADFGGVGAVVTVLFAAVVTIVAAGALAALIQDWRDL